MHLGAFHKASKFKRLSSSRFPILCASWGLLQSKQTQQANSNALSLRGFPSCVHLGAFRRASRLNCLSSSGLSQSKQIQTSFLFEVSYPVRILGPFAERANSASKFERLVFSRFPILRTSWGLSQSKQIELPFLFEVSYLVCILGPFTEQANSNVFPLRGFLSCAHLGAFCRASKLSKQIRTPCLFEVSHLAYILGPFAEQAD